MQEGRDPAHPSTPPPCRTEAPLWVEAGVGGPRLLVGVGLAPCPSAAPLGTLWGRAAGSQAGPLTTAFSLGVRVADSPLPPPHPGSEGPPQLCGAGLGLRCLLRAAACLPCLPGCGVCPPAAGTRAPWQGRGWRGSGPHPAAVCPGGLQLRSPPPPHAGLSPTQAWLRLYGYLPQPSRQMSTMHSAQTFSSALAEMQKFYGITVTGILDEETKA